VRELLVEKKYKIIGMSKLELLAYLNIVQSIILKAKLSEGEVNHSMYKYHSDDQMFTEKSLTTQMAKCDAAYFSAKIPNIGYTSEYWQIWTNKYIDPEIRSHIVEEYEFSEERYYSVEGFGSILFQSV